ncbi:MAG: hypothetical protein JNJ61_08235 [Anaerolineae bacterium]|nr:hypothetical protein [Anaerolineae bacterium]
MRYMWFAGMLMLLLAACGQPSAETLPTLAATALPPEETALVEAAPPSATPIPLGRATLPPTWTPSPEPTSAVIEPAAQNTEAVPATVEQPQGQATLVVCGTFVVDRERSLPTFTFGSAPAVYWTAVVTAARYRINLIDETGTEIFVDYTLEPNYTFAAELFERGKRYAWEVYPEDALGQQMCLKRGQELFPQ